MHFKVVRVLGGLLCLLISGESQAAGIARLRDPVQNTVKAVAFREYSALTAKQQELLKTSALAITGEPEWQQWVTSQDGSAAAFLAISQALSLVELSLSDGSRVTGLDMISQVVRFEGDRIRVLTHREFFEDWMRSGGRFECLACPGGSESGQIAFNRGDIGGSLHAGYDRQGYTSRWKVPRLQWNYRFSDGGADIDLDGYAPLVDGWIPNPMHLTWENSDPRFWLAQFVAKFGEPGFQVRQDIDW